MAKLKDGAQQLTYIGNPMPATGPKISKPRLALLLKIYPGAEEFRKLVELANSRNELAIEEGLTAHDVGALERYYEINPSTYRRAHRERKAVDVDALAERLWLNVQPKIAEMIIAGLYRADCINDSDVSDLNTLFGTTVVIQKVGTVVILEESVR